MIPILAIAILVYSVVPGFSRIPYVGPAVKQAKLNSGIMVLFMSEKGLTQSPIYYRYYTDGKWQAREKLMDSLFETYSKTGYYGALKHCRLDGAISRNLYHEVKAGRIENIEEKRIFMLLKKHFIQSHSNNKVVDSVEFSFYAPDTISHKEMKLLLTIKDTP
ncbi:hypothetical protein ACLI1A_18850 [Flavobacterium sp. RHBU_3]|uniref:hypothetical protein n=1 Tax=Flavobacterium sp. RHBU_3 TaxID=3391184 RepID=UPI003984A60C